VSLIFLNADGLAGSGRTLVSRMCYTTSESDTEARLYASKINHEMSRLFSNAGCVAGSTQSLASRMCDTVSELRAEATQDALKIFDVKQNPREGGSCCYHC
jgi:hypothetical protein